MGLFNISYDTITEGRNRLTAFAQSNQPTNINEAYFTREYGISLNETIISALKLEAENAIIKELITFLFEHSQTPIEEFSFSEEEIVNYLQSILHAGYDYMITNSFIASTIQSRIINFTYVDYTYTSMSENRRINSGYFSKIGEINQRWYNIFNRCDVYINSLMRFEDNRILLFTGTNFNIKISNPIFIHSEQNPYSPSINNHYEFYYEIDFDINNLKIMKFI